MACRTPAENAADTPASVLITKRIVELKKKLLLAGKVTTTFKEFYIQKYSYRGSEKSLCRRMDTTNQAEFRCSDGIEKGNQGINWEA